ncbi:MAG: ABC transporter ATP-binding protein, partial [Candidatus Binatota bacterium]
MSDAVIRIEKLKKKYGPIIALDDISLEVEKGKIFGLLGPNGAGKTTTVKILTTLVRPDEGKVVVAGTDVLGDPVRVRSLIGYVPQELTVDPYLTVQEHLNYYADLYHLSAAVKDSRAREVLGLVGLAGYENRRARYLSGGTKKKLDLACGLIHRPPLIILDEPSLGLDVQVRRDVWSYILRLKDQGTTVFLCTNYMDEAERLC